MIKSMTITFGATVALFAVLMLFDNAMQEYFNFPVVFYSDSRSKCVKVISEFNQYSCADVDKKFTRYERVIVR